MPSQRTSHQRRFCRCVSRPSFQQLIALALVAALLAPTSALARPLASGRQSPPPSLLTVAAGDMWRTLAAFINSAQDERRGMARRLAPERPLPERIAPEQPPTKAERATRVARLETNARGRLELEVGQLTMLVATPLDAEGNAVHGLVAEWQSSDPQVVWVTPDGEAEARQPGVARLTAVLDHHRVTVPVQVAPRRAAQPQTEPQSARQRRLPNDAAGVRFINARSSPGDEARFAGAALRAGGAKMMRAAPAADGRHRRPAACRRGPVALHAGEQRRPAAGSHRAGGGGAARSLLRHRDAALGQLPRRRASHELTRAWPRP